MKTCFTALLVEFVAMAQFVYPLHDIHPNAECARNLESWVKYQKLLEPNKRDGEPFRGVLYQPYYMNYITDKNCYESWLMNHLDNSYPVCNPRTGEYKSMQCKIGSDADEEFCKCVYPDTNRPIYGRGLIFVTNLSQPIKPMGSRTVFYWPTRRRIVKLQRHLYFSEQNENQTKIYADNERKQLLELSRANFPVLFSGKNFKCEWFHKDTKNKKTYSNWKRFVTKVPYQLGLFCNSKFTKNNRCIDKKTSKLN